MTTREEYRGIIDRVIRGGQHGPYAVAKTKELGFVTFALAEPVWAEAQWPEPGTYVVLSGLTKKRAGWRASHGRFLRPSDEQLA